MLTLILSFIPLHTPKSFSKEFQHWVKVFEREINAVRRLNLDAVKTRRLDLLEVMCSPESKLTKQVHQHQGQAQRFGMSEGDLRKPEARMRLFQIIMLKCPKHLWYSPECGPWSMWNFLNMNKSVELEEKLMNKRFDHVWQIALGTYTLSMAGITWITFSLGTTGRFRHVQVSGTGGVATVL